MNIVRLIVKDLRLQASFLPLLLAIQIGGVFLFLVQFPGAEIPGVALGMLHGVMLIGDFLVCYRTLVAEEKNRAFLFLKTLPVSTADIILAKFGVNFLLVTANTLVLFALYGAIHAAGWLRAGSAISLQVVVMGLTVHWLNNAFSSRRPSCSCI